jgi:hypothetical protein
MRPWRASASRSRDRARIDPWAAERKSEPVRTDEAKPTKEELLRQVDEALARRREHRKRFFEALERFEKRVR